MSRTKSVLDDATPHQLVKRALTPNDDNGPWCLVVTDWAGDMHCFGPFKSSEAIDKWLLKEFGTTERRFDCREYGGETHAMMLRLRNPSDGK